MADLMEQSDEIQEILGQNYAVPDVDEADLDAELAALGDDFLADNSASYLDEALSDPTAIAVGDSGSGGGGGGGGGGGVALPAVPAGGGGSGSGGGSAVPVDEFGLPQLSQAR